MTLLVVSPDFASHYGPLAVLARAAGASGRRVVIATGGGMRPLVEAGGFEWRHLQLGADSNAGIVARGPAVERFLAATGIGPAATIRRQALDREHDLLWNPEQVATEIADLCCEFDSADGLDVLVDHVSFGSTLAMYATGRPFVSLVPGHPSQLPVADERYGIPKTWPSRLEPSPGEVAQLATLAARVTHAFTERWNAALATIAPHRDPVDDAFRVHGRRVLYNSLAAHHDPARTPELPADHRFVGPLVRDESLPDALSRWAERRDDRRQVYVGLGTFLSYRSDVLAKIVEALRAVGARAAVAVGATSIEDLGPIPRDWIVAPQLPQVAVLRHADLAIHHGGNNTTQETLASGVRQLVLPFSTDQFATAADLERVGAAAVMAPNDVSSAELAAAVYARLLSAQPVAEPRVRPEDLVDALFG